MDATRVGLVLSGAVSLGSYEGGAVTELLYGFAEHNKAHPDKRFIIDIIVGASAGSMTGALLARTLLYDRNMEDVFHSAWVDEVDILKLLEPTTGQTLLSNRIINGIAAKHLGWLNGPADPHPAWKIGPDDTIMDGETITLAFALSNLNGIEYDLQSDNRINGMGTTIFTDWVEFEMGVQKRLDSDEWDIFREAALASGAFPIAFEHKAVKRNPSDYRPGILYDVNLNPISMDYVDGGLFNNEPLSLAMRIAKDKDSESQYERIFILVDPYLSDLSPHKSFPKDIPLTTLLGRLVSVVLGGASEQEWIRSELLDLRIQMKDAFLKYVDRIVNQTELKSEEERGEFRQSLNDLTRKACEKKRIPANQTIDSFCALNLKRIDDTIRSDPETFPMSHTNQFAKIDSLKPIVFLLELVSGLRSRQSSRRYLIAPPRGSLAGDGIANFMGFFDRAWREHDYVKGRADTKKFLQRSEILGAAYAGNPQARYQPEKDYSKAKISDLPEEQREKISEALKEKIENILQKMGFGWTARKAIKYFAGNKIDELLKS